MKKLLDNKLLLTTIIVEVCYYISYFLVEYIFESPGILKYVFAPIILLFSFVVPFWAVCICIIAAVSLIMIIVNLIRKKSISWLIAPFIISTISIVINKLFFYL